MSEKKSPLTHTVIKNKIIRKDSDGRVNGILNTNKPVDVCDYITALDEELWSLRRIHSKKISELEIKIKVIRDITQGV